MNEGHDAPVAVIGGGPAGLMAAEVLSDAGVAVDLYDRMPSVGRKFLMAGVGGLNLTHAEPYADLVARYGTAREALAPQLDAFGPQALRDWAAALGVATFVGTSNRVFPTDMKAAPLLRAWLHRLRARGVRLHMRHRWLGWDAGAELLRFETPAGILSRQAAAVVLALGGGSWPKLGSTGDWTEVLAARGVGVAPLLPSNCGFDVAWSPFMQARFAGAPVKPVAARLAADADAAAHVAARRGEFVVAATGVEGSLIYALSAPIRDRIRQHGEAWLELDLLPDLTPARVAAALERPRGRRSLSSHLQSRLNLTGVKTALLRECLPDATFDAPDDLARAIKALPLRLRAARPLAEAISSAGGVRFDAIAAHGGLSAMPNVFCAGEMLDWEAPTGGYLLTACFASGLHAGRAALARLRATSAHRS
ncbi:TIGR03862 family flavoprotein [Chitinasiproducens palmae]|uniref:NAD(FAD)-utilizing dehydrogenase n=1 Tax=Chitinasiproducens palmae TaxID=1770053 RepID=A0A1H2PWR3_9BURK|nr:TIGR03862 family flavoprotein [Chitinasiproducens palmae]SDV51496.1 hypothetical protein SAMN05216551_1184 [Chitinasiproducens palmae]